MGRLGNSRAKWTRRSRCCVWGGRWLASVGRPIRCLELIRSLLRSTRLNLPPLDLEPYQDGVSGETAEARRLRKQDRSHVPKK